jgi:prepilin-type N-terminal cleavage/methylation domain-containing protein
MKLNLQRGFTLIELLVVIAIIGILSSVVLASLNSARDKGADAAIRGNIGGIRAQAELVFDDNGGQTYVTGLFTTDNASRNAVTAADSANGAGLVATTSSTTGWAASAQLKSNTALWYCVDSTGNATATTQAAAGTAALLASNGCL